MLIYLVLRSYLFATFSDFCKVDNVVGSALSGVQIGSNEGPETFVVVHVFHIVAKDCLHMTAILLLSRCKEVKKICEKPKKISYKNKGSGIRMLGSGRTLIMILTIIRISLGL